MFLKKLFKKKTKKIDLTSPWNVLWDNWSNGKLEDPYASLCTYSVALMEMDIIAFLIMK